MELQNPKIDGSTTSVPQIIDAIPRKVKESIKVKGTIPILDTHWSFNRHCQGIAPLNAEFGTLGNGSITVNSSAGFFVTFQTISPNQMGTVLSVTIPSNMYDHAAGTQRLGDLLVVPLEISDDDTSKGLVVFYDLTHPNAPAFLYKLTAPTEKSSAAAITRYIGADGQDWCMLMDYQYDDHQMFIWRALAEDVTNGPSAWTAMPTYEGDRLNTGDQYQCFSLVTQTNADGTDTVYLVGFRQDEEVWVWTVNTDDASYGEPTLVDHYTEWNGSDFRMGTGLQIPSKTNLRIFGTPRDPSGSINDYTFNIHVYYSR